MMSLVKYLGQWISWCSRETHQFEHFVYRVVVVGLRWALDWYWFPVAVTCCIYIVRHFVGVRWTGWTKILMLRYQSARPWDRWGGCSNWFLVRWRHQTRVKFKLVFEDNMMRWRSVVELIRGGFIDHRVKRVTEGIIIIGMVSSKLLICNACDDVDSRIKFRADWMNRQGDWIHRVSCCATYNRSFYNLHTWRWQRSHVLGN